MLEPAVTVKGLHELQAALAHAERDVRLGVRAELRSVARPIQQDAQRLAASEITGMARSPRWAGMRIGVTRNLVYVAPRQKGVRGGPKRRPNLAGLMMARAMEPALEGNRESTVRAFEQMLDTVADTFNREP